MTIDANNGAQSIPGDLALLRSWFNPMRACRLAAQGAAGKITIMTFKILLDEYGQPVRWTEPAIIKLEPRGAVYDLLDLLGEE